MASSLALAYEDDPLAQALENADAPLTERTVSEAESAKRQLILRKYLEVDSIYFAYWFPVQSEIIQYIWPNRAEFFQVESNKGWQKDLQILDNTATIAGRKLTAALDTGITSEARVWFTLASIDPNDMEDPGVAEYCHTVQTILFALIAKSNFYKSHRNVLDDLVGVATGAMLIEEDEEDVFRCTHLPPGQYRCSTDSKGRVNRLARRFTLTASQMVEEFGEENVSISVKSSVQKGLLNIPYQVIQWIEPRTVRDPNRRDAKGKPWASYWIEIGSGTWAANTVPGLGEITPSAMGPTGILRESGYDIQPFVVPRWNTIGTDAYGKDSPGWVGLSDVKSLQALMLMGAGVVSLISEPPLDVPDELKNASLIPGAVYHRRAGGGNAKVEPLVNIPVEAVTVIREEKKDHRERIQDANFGSVLMLVSNGGESTTPASATEINAKRAEQLLQLGGIFNRVSDEDLKPAIGAFFYYAQKAGKFPKPPDRLTRHGKLKIAFQNPLVTAQRTVEFGSIQQVLSMAQACASAQEAGVDQVDFDEVNRESVTMLGVNPKVLKDADRLQQERAQKQQAASAQAQAAALQAGAPAVKQLSDANPDRLNQLLGPGGPIAQAMGGGMRQ